MKAGELRIGSGVSKLIETQAAQEAPRSGELARASDFGEGQIAGPFGPQFVGFGPMALRLHWLNWRGTAGIAVGLAAASLALMFATGRL